MIKELGKVAVVIAALFMVSVMAGCQVNVNTDDSNKKDEGAPRSNIDYTNYEFESALTVKNNASSNMVLFHGVPSNNQILGGVKGHDTVSLKNNPDIFKTSHDYIVYVIKEDDYKANENNLAALDNAPYTTFYAVYNKGAPNENVYEISKFLGGDYRIIINNNTDYNVELRNMSPSGETIAFSMGQTYEKSYSVKDGEYMLWPVFRKYDSRTHEIISVYPTYKTGELAGQAKSIEFSLDRVTKSKQFSVSDWAEGINFSPSAAYIKIINNSNEGIQFFAGSDTEPAVTSTGGKRINTNQELTYSIDMQKLTNVNGVKYEDEKKAAGFHIRTNRSSPVYLAGSQEITTTYKAGKLYTYTVSGSVEKGFKITPLTNEDGSLKEQDVDWSSDL